MNAKNPERSPQVNKVNSEGKEEYAYCEKHALQSNRCGCNIKELVHRVPIEPTPKDNKQECPKCNDGSGIICKECFYKSIGKPTPKAVEQSSSVPVKLDGQLELLFDMLKTHKVNYLPELLTQPTGIIGIDQAFSTFKIWLSKMQVIEQQKKA